MCTNPILIRNRKYRDIRVKIRSSYIQVPCGVCDECLSSKANDLYVRARYEYDACLRSGGCGYMCCLTYDDSTLPFFYHLGKKYMVFNKKHIIDFLKRLRTKLDRFYNRFYNRSAPDFKYLVTCEYGSDPSKTHRPHYHMLFFFPEDISYNTFKALFESCIYVRKNNKISRVFGYIYQCDYLDSSAGIKYCGKYILKDLMYEPQRKSIIDKIKFYTEYVNNRFGILPFPQNASDEIYNKAIRSTKKYRKALAQYVRPYRHMLQFYMLSNDLGVSAIINKYGESIVNMPCLNFEDIPFRFPKLVKQRIEQNYGSAKRDVLNKSIFINFLNSAVAALVFKRKINFDEADNIVEFAKKFIFPRSGTLYLVNPEGFNHREHLENGSSLANYDDCFVDYDLFFASGFMEMRSKLLHILSLYDSKEMRDFRASVAHQKREKQRMDYEQRKRNKPSKLF